MKVKTADLIGPALDWAVAIITNPEWTDEDRWYNAIGYVDCGEPDDEPYSPSTDWRQGGPIIGREHISVDNRKGDPCLAFKGTPVHYEFSMFAPEGQPLVAAMRCFVASRLGDEVDIPEELL